MNELDSLFVHSIMGLAVRVYEHYVLGLARTSKKISVRNVVVSRYADLREGTLQQINISKPRLTGAFKWSSGNIECMVKLYRNYHYMLKVSGDELN